MIEKNCQILNETNKLSRGKMSYNLKEIQAILGVCQCTARKIVRSNQFPSIHLGKEVRISKAEFDAWLDNQKKEVAK